MAIPAHLSDIEHDRAASFRCAACGVNTAGAAFAVPDHEYGLSFVATYVECGSCKTLTQTPMPSLSELASFYPDTYHSFHNRTLIVRAKNALRLRRLRKLCSSATGAVLDYGCGDGSFLVEAAKALPLTFYGYEIGDTYERRVLENGRVVIVRGTPDDLFRELPPCQLITLNHVIEHLPDPFETIGRLAKALIPGGRIEGQTPNSHSLERKVFGLHWSGYHAPRHTVIFSREGLRTLLQRDGLRDGEVTPAFNPAGLAVSFASLPHHAGGIIRRGGWSWLFCLGLAALVYPIDILSGLPGIINFSARK